MIKNSIDCLILAAGNSSRMKSDTPKALQSIAGESFLYRLLASTQNLGINQWIIIQSKDRPIKDSFLTSLNNSQKNTINWDKIIWQNQLANLGTANAVQSGLNKVTADHHCLILYGDVPLISEQTLARLIDKHINENIDITLITQKINNPTGYGRIVRDEKGMINRICEHKDADKNTQKITEINTGLMIAKSDLLKKYLNQINNNTAQKEYYLTDLVEIAANNGFKIASIEPIKDFEVKGVNDFKQLAQLERQYQYYLAEKLMLEGVKIIDPHRFDIQGNLICAKNVSIGINTQFIGDVILENGVEIGANCIIENSIIKQNSQILPFSLISKSTIGKNNIIGPFARIRPDTQTDKEVKIGNFVEIKKSIIGQNSKINHLSYVGDSQIGQNVNIGAGVITCNYDGKNKQQTQIDDYCFVGSGSQLIAPIHLAAHSYIGAGTTLTKNTDSHSLNITRAKLKQIKRKK